MSKQSTLSVSLIKSLIGRLPKHRATVKGLGLRKLGSSVTLKDTPEIRGMISQVNYLLRVEQTNEF